VELRTPAATGQFRRVPDHPHPAPAYGPVRQQAVPKSGSTKEWSDHSPGGAPLRRDGQTISRGHRSFHGGWLNSLSRTDLATSFTTFYESCPVLRAPSEESRASRLILCEVTARTLATGLDLLGIEAPERM